MRLHGCLAWSNNSARLRSTYVCAKVKTASESSWSYSIVLMLRHVLRYIGQHKVEKNYKGDATKIPLCLPANEAMSSCKAWFSFRLHVMVANFATVKCREINSLSSRDEIRPGVT